MFRLKVIIPIITFSFVFASKSLSIKPIVLIEYFSEGNDYIISDNPITIFGAGLGTYYKNNQWIIDTEYIQLGLLGNIDETIFNFSPMQSFPYLDDSKDADGYWSEYATAKVRYISNDFEINFGKFDRRWGFGKRSLHISDKPPSYPQIGFEWKITNKFKFIYFTGFLNSGITDTNRAAYYNDNERSLNILRNIAAHRIEWEITKNFTFSFNESVIYATRNLDPHYIIPVSLFYPIENYLGDTDNLQMGCDILFSPNINNKFYLGFFMDELTPEWLFQSKNHNWFAWQLGYNGNNIFFDNEKFFIEYNWTDQRIYKHKFEVNDFYSHNQPLGFWAGPHSQEFLIDYVLQIYSGIISLNYSNIKRGLSTREMVKENYIDNQTDRFADGSEQKKSFTIFFDRSSKVNDLYYRIGINYVKFTNVGFNILQTGLTNEKLSFNIGLYYNFQK